MKYYYVSRNGLFRNNAFIGKGIERINRNKDKIIITRIEDSFHVLVCIKGTYEREKLVLSCFDLVNYLKKVFFDIYFVNLNKETVDYIISHVNSNEKVDMSEIQKDLKEEFYAIDNDNMYELEARINKNVIKKAIYTIYEKEINDSNGCHYISISDFFDNEELFELYHLPFKEKNGEFLIPNYSYSQPKPFYILSGIYRKNGDVISLSSIDIKNICMIGNVEKDVASEILSNIELRIIERQSLSAINNVADCIDKYDKSTERKNAILKVLRDNLVDAKDNKVLFDNLRLLNENSKKEKLLNK